MDPTVILTFLLKHWKVIATAIVIGGLVTYITTLRVERDHYKKKANEIAVQLSDLENKNKEREAQRQVVADELTAKYKNSLKDATTLTIENARLNAENIKNAKELRDVKLSLAAVRLFNASKQPDQPAPEAKPRDDEKATTVETTSSVNLQDLLLVVNENDANHLACIKTVDEWQNFWLDYVKKTEAVDARVH